MNKIKDYNLVCTNLNNRCHLTCIERTGSIVSVFLGKADFLCADPRISLGYHFDITCMSLVYHLDITWISLVYHLYMT